MANAEENVRAWLAELNEDEFEVWDKQESAGESWEDDIFSSEANTSSMPDLVSENSPLTSFDDPSSESDIPELTLEVDATAEGYWTNAEDVSEDPNNDVPNLMSVSDSSDEGSEMPDLVSVSDSSEGSSDSESDDSVDEIGGWFDVPIEMVDETVDCGIKPETRTYSTAMLASIASASPNREIELYDSGASRHMSPYCQNFINFVRIKGQTITAANGQEFMATRLGDMHVELPNGKSMSWILLKDVLYAPNMGATLISISKIASAGFKTIFHKDLLKIFGLRDSALGCIMVQKSLYRVEHEPREVVANVTTDTVTIEELHRIMGHISPEVARKLIEDGLVEGVKLDRSSDIWSCDSCEYAKAHRKPIRKEREEP